MRSAAAYPLRFIAVLCLASAIPGSVFADTIYLKNGRKITATHVVQENGQVSYETSAGRLSLPVSIVEKVVREAEPLDSTPGPAADKAAHMPIAPPNMLNRSANDEVARAMM